MNSQKRLIIRLGLSVLLIVSLCILMLAMFGDPSPKAYNTRTITQLQQYVTALELLRLDHGIYPIAESPICLGDYEDDACWDKGGKGVKEDSLFNDAMDAFVPLLSAGKMVEDKNDPIQSREGYTYRSKNDGQGYEIQYLLIGKNKQCGFGADLSLTVAESKSAENTLCTISR